MSGGVKREQQPCSGLNKCWRIWSIHVNNSVHFYRAQHHSDSRGGVWAWELHSCCHCMAEAKALRAANRLHLPLEPNTMPLAAQYSFSSFTYSQRLRRAWHWQSLHALLHATEPTRSSHTPNPHDRRSAWTKNGRFTAGAQAWAAQTPRPERISPLHNQTRPAPSLAARRLSAAAGARAAPPLINVARTAGPQ